MNSDPDLKAMWAKACRAEARHHAIRTVLKVVGLVAVGLLTVAAAAVFLF